MILLYLNCGFTFMLFFMGFSHTYIDVLFISMKAAKSPISLYFFMSFLIVFSYVRIIFTWPYDLYKFLKG